MHFRLDVEKKLWQPLNEQNVCSDLVHTVLIDWIIHLVLLQPF